ncbi:RagB/SusD family nutrient uptake outer membrane protein [Echinicola sp. CAU 1574]|uniref:RagB/SusD family nutrient uptake outer membrane protein n=1 Tax=Echinicola arenosa TaxID=2774144 RepID=A0ABR9AP29_9BACT|nr:RagB/SusD family nutrient uptake outer membrane protein [Echinicola arenosa]MBD8490071.1 RagB/SusD family nutrient uptake outer membrane protein [Echinicola arenosa]
MKNKLSPIFTIMIISILHLLTSCEEFLDERPDKNIVIPQTTEDLQALLDANNMGMNDAPSLGILSSDDLIITEEGFQGLRNEIEQNAYLWKEEIFIDFGADWATPYQQVFYANTVLDQAKEISPVTPEETSELATVVASARFYRSNAFLNLLFCFAPAYENGNNEHKLGIPLQLSGSINEAVSRADLETSYAQVINDLEVCINDLPDINEYVTRPSKVAAHALLARCYLSMGSYEKSLEHAEAALLIKHELLDYALVATDSRYAFDLDSPELLFYNQVISYSYMASSMTLVNPSLYAFYEEGDYRKEVLFNEQPDGNGFKGNYTGGFRYFTGLAVDEMYLIKAECLVRVGEIDEGMETLNELRSYRIKENSFSDLEANSKEEALDLVLMERRKELLFRGLRWMDLKRLNLEPGRQMALQRTLDGRQYELLPNSNRYVLPIPPNEINISGIVQNSR